MAQAYLALGSNLGDKAANLREALRRLGAEKALRLGAVSSFWRTPPWGPVPQDWYLNAVLAVETPLAPEALLEVTQRIERTMGRTRTTRWGPRLIDIDLLLHGEEARHGERLMLPHPAMLQRAFVLVPLAEIAPGLMLRGESVEAHLARLERAGIERDEPALAPA